LSAVEDMASYWNGVYRAAGRGMPRADGWLDEHLAYLPARAGARILDLGCGRGANAACLAQKGYSVVACDLSRVALGQVAHAACAGQIVCLDMRDALPFADEAFAAIVADLSLHYLGRARTRQIEREVYRVLVGGGVLLGRVNSTQDRGYGAGLGVKVEANYVEIDGHYKRFFDPEQVRELFRDWRIEQLTARTTLRYGRPKQVIAFVCLKRGDLKGPALQLQPWNRCAAPVSGEVRNRHGLFPVGSSIGSRDQTRELERGQGA
jgi:SAM-dependent methyltransferase